MITKNFSLNEPQAIALNVNANKTWLVWARATGKTTGALGPKSLDMVHKMPRAKGGFIGKDYEQIFDRTLPEIAAVWEALGYHENRHWRIGKPLDWWERPYIPPMKWDNVISWYNGTAIHLLSLAVKAPANGLSLQWLMGDEAKYWRPNLLKEILKALRGNAREFGHLPEYCGYWFATDKWTDDIADIQWILDKRKQMDARAVDVVLSLQLEINKMRDAYHMQPEDERRVTDKEIHKIESLINPIRRQLIYFSEASAADNLDVLGMQYLSSQQADLPKNEFDVAIKNLDPTESERAFYPTFGEMHLYSSVADISPVRPLIIAADYQASISPIPVAQIGGLPGGATDTLNFVKSIFTLQPLSLTDALKKFDKSFRFHIDRTVYYVYDHTAIGRNGFGKTYAELVREVLTELGWHVVNIYLGKAPGHGIKYEKIKNIYSNTDPIKWPLVRHNRDQNEPCIVSMQRARAIQSGGMTQKDKRHENIHKYPDYPQQYATHFSDAHDMILWATHILKLIPFSSSTAPFTSALL